MNRLSMTTVGGKQYVTHYDAAGRVVEEWVRTASPSEIGPGAENPVAPTAPIAPTAPPSNASQAEKDAYARQLTQYNLDLADYRVKQQNYEADARNYNEQGRLARLINSVARVSSGFEHRMRGYNEAGHIVVEQGFSENGNVKFRSHNDAIDKTGNVLRYRTDSFAGEHATSTYTNSYVVGANGTALSGTTGQMLIRTGELAGKYGSMASTTLRYDGNGSLFDVNYLPHEGEVAGNKPRSKHFYTDAEGRILLWRASLPSYFCPN